MVKKAAAEIPNYRAECLHFQVEHYFTSAARTWQYGRPAPPKGNAKDKTIWDARTGEVLYSEVVKGGRAGKPYRSPKFYFEPTEKELVTRLKPLLEGDAKRLALQNSP